MPRSYKKKKPPPSYSLQDLQEAVQMVMEKKMSQREAQKKYGIPKSVIQLRVSGKVSIEHKGAGRPTTLTEKDEQDIAECLLARAKFGYPCDRRELLNLVAEYVKTNNIINVFTDGVPGEDWYLGFMRRHPRLTLKKPELLQALRKQNATPDIVYDFYDTLQSVYEDKNLINPDKACFVFNTDESGFKSDPSRLRGIGEKGKSLSRVSGGSGRESTTVLACASASGAVMPPFVVFKGAAVQPRWVSEKAYPDTHYAVSKGGWMEGPIFYNWFMKAFVPYVNKIRDVKGLPNHEVALIYDGHASHVTLQLCKAALENKVTLIRLPSHLTDKLQPLDKCVFGPVKTNWERLLVEHGKLAMGQNHQRLSKKNFVELLGEVWHLSMTPANIISGFRSTGIFPINPLAFPVREFNPIDLQKYKKKKEEKMKIYEEETTAREKEKGERSEIEIEISSQKQLILNNTPSVAPSTSTYNPLQSKPAPSIENTSPSTSQQTPKSVIEIFAETLKNSNKKLEIPITPTKKIVNRRLKPERYGEVLTTKEVMERLQEAETIKALKLKKKDKSKAASKGKGKKMAVNVKNKRKVEETEEKNKGGVSIEKNEEEKRLKKIKRKKGAVRTLDLSSSSSDLEDILSDSESAPLSDLELEQEEVEYVQPEEKNLIPGNYILANVMGGYRKTTNYKYVCCIQSMLDESEDFGDSLKIQVMGLRRFDEHSTTFYPDESDVFLVEKQQILSVLPDPKIIEKDRKLMFVFPGSVSVFEQA